MRDVLCGINAALRNSDFFCAMLVALPVSSWHCGLAVAAEPELRRGDSLLRFYCSASPCISICF